jgi:ribonuclease BN (tRNA processing enzyme)
VRLTVLGGCGAWPSADQACSGYLVEHDGFRLLIDPGYAILPRLLQGLDADEVDAVLVSHGHPDHCADLMPGSSAQDSAQAAAQGYAGPVTVACPGLVAEPGR